MMRARAFATRLLLASTIVATAAPLAAQEGTDFHTNPACWDGPRMFHTGEPAPEWAGRLHVIAAPATTPPGEPAVSPNGAYRFWVRRPDATQPGPWGAGIIVDHERDEHLVLLVEDVAAAYGFEPRWINEKLIMVRIAWGRVMFSDVILDVEAGEVIYHEVVRDGVIPFQQYQQFQAECGAGLPIAAELPPLAILPPATPNELATIGLLTLPTIFGPPESGGVRPADDPAPVPVYVKPAQGADKLGDFVDMDAFDYREYTYEGAAVVVLEAEGPWYRIGLNETRGARARSGWIHGRSAGDFHPIESLLTGQAHLEELWDGAIWAAPEAGAARTLSGFRREGLARPAEVAFRLLETRRIGDGLWLHVETIEGACSAADARVVDRGWVPAYNDQGDLVVWFSSRGC